MRLIKADCFAFFQLTIKSLVLFVVFGCTSPQQVTKTRCPRECPPVELQEPVSWSNPQIEGVCREGRVYFLSRMFFECSKGI